LGKPVEFGHKAQLVEGDDGVIVDNNIERGNPADAPQLAPAVERVTQRAGRPPRKVTADRGYGEKSVDDALRDLGVRNVVIPRKGKASPARRAEAHRQAFRRTLKWRTGVEGRISTLKRGYGWDRTRIERTQGAKIWVGHGVLAHNLVKISTLGRVRAARGPLRPDSAHRDGEPPATSRGRLTSHRRFQVEVVSPREGSARCGPRPRLLESPRLSLPRKSGCRPNRRGWRRR
jgi:hypothetical protein